MKPKPILSTIFEQEKKTNSKIKTLFGLLNLKLTYENINNVTNIIARNKCKR